jgi:hypothetical protein
MSQTDVSDTINFHNIKNVRQQILRKNMCDLPYIPTMKEAKQVITDYDVFPYNRYFRGVTRSPDPIIAEREAGNRHRNDGCYNISSYFMYCPYQAPYAGGPVGAKDNPGGTSGRGTGIETSKGSCYLAHGCTGYPNPQQRCFGSTWDEVGGGKSLWSGTPWQECCKPHNVTVKEEVSFTDIPFGGYKRRGMDGGHWIGE